MKLKHTFALLGLRPRPRRYGYKITTWTLPRDGEIQFAQWLHPKDRPKEFHQPAVDELRRFLSPGDVAIDIGAQSGDTALPIALAVGPSGRVFALEPNSYVFPILQKNSELNRGKINILPLQFAAAPADMELTFEYSDSGYCNGGRHEGVSKWRHGHAFPLTVPGRNLEQFLRANYPADVPRIRYIKIDVEGFELNVLETIASLIDNSQPFVRAEIYKHSPDATRRRLFEFFTTRNYTLHRIDGDNHVFGDRIDAARASDWVHYDLIAVPPNATVRNRS